MVSHSVSKEDPFHCAYDLRELIKSDIEKVVCKKTGRTLLFPKYECPTCKRKYTSISDFSDFDKVRLRTDIYTNITREQDIVRFNALSKKQNYGIKRNRTPSNIEFKDFVVKRTVFKCAHSEHKLQDIDATIAVLYFTGEIKETTISAGYCPNCDVFFLMEDAYQSLKLRGIPLCRISEEKAYLSSDSSHNEMNLALESILMQYGYNVSQSEGLSSTTRRTILSLLIDNKICSRTEIISYLNFFISQRKMQRQYALAIEKWESDRKFVSEYRVGAFSRYGISMIRRKNY